MPNSPDYCPEALSEHLLDIGWSEVSIEYEKEELSAEEFREVMYTRFIKGRYIWFQSFKEGVTLDGKCQYA